MLRTGHAACLMLVIITGYCTIVSLVLFLLPDTAVMHAFVVLQLVNFAVCGLLVMMTENIILTTLAMISSKSSETAQKFSGNAGAKEGESNAGKESTIATMTELVDATESVDTIEAKDVNKVQNPVAQCNLPMIGMEMGK